VRYYRLLTLLPPLPSSPQRLPVPLSALLADIREELSGPAWELVLLLLLRGRVEAREAELRDREHSAGAALPPRELPLVERDEQELLEQYPFLRDPAPGDELVTSSTLPEQIALLWRQYFLRLAEEAERRGSRFLLEYAAWETSLAIGLARQRGLRLGRAVEDELPPPPFPEVAVAALLGQLAEQPAPLARERLLDAARLQVIDDLAGADPFSLDAVLAYVAAAVVLDRWDLPEQVDLAKLLEEFP